MTGSGLHQPYWPPLVIAALLAALTFWLGRLAQTAAPQDLGGFAHDPDYIVERFQAVAFDAQGEQRYLLAAERMTHYMDDDTTALDQPRFALHETGRPSWRASAARGVVSSNGENVHLLDDVRVEQTMAAQPVVLTTQYLWVIPEAEVLRTDQAVTLRQGESVVTARGMELDGRQRSLELAGRVKGTYESRH